jgi:hypothetical protein
MPGNKGEIRECLNILRKVHYIQGLTKALATDLMVGRHSNYVNRPEFLGMLMISNAGKNCNYFKIISFSFGRNMRTLPVGRPYWQMFLSQLNDGLILLLVAFAIM